MRNSPSPLGSHRDIFVLARMMVKQARMMKNAGQTEVSRSLVRRARALTRFQRMAAAAS